MQIQAFTFAIFAIFVVPIVCPGHKHHPNAMPPSVQNIEPGDGASRNLGKVPASGTGATGSAVQDSVKTHNQGVGDPIRAPSPLRSTIGGANAVCGEVLATAKIGSFTYKHHADGSKDDVQLCFKDLPWSKPNHLKMATIKVDKDEDPGTKVYRYIKSKPSQKTARGMASLQDELLTGANFIYDDKKQTVIKLDHPITKIDFERLKIPAKFSWFERDCPLPGTCVVEVVNFTLEQCKNAMRQLAQNGYHPGDYVFAWDPSDAGHVHLCGLGDNKEVLTATINVADDGQVEFNGAKHLQGKAASLEELTNEFVTNKGYIYDDQDKLMQPRTYIPA